LGGPAARGGGADHASNTNKHLALPIGIRNSRKGFFNAGKLTGLPNSLQGLGAQEEQGILRCLAEETNKYYCLNIDENVVVSRGTGAPENDANTGRVFLVGSSHLHRIATSPAAAKIPKLVSDMPRWATDGSALSSVAEMLSTAEIKENDLVILDLFSNMIFSGSDDLGNPQPAFKEGGKFHLTGYVDISPTPKVRRMAASAGKLAESAGRGKIVFVLPLPRYVVEGCCKNEDHCANRLHADYEEVLRSASTTVEAAITREMAATNISFTIWDPTSTFAGDTLRGLRSGNGASIWRGDDPMHLTDAAYADQGGAMAAMAGGSGQTDEMTTRKRLASIIYEDIRPATRGGRGGQAPGLPARQQPPPRGRERGWSGRRFNPY
jgi:hypothetical protein